MEGSQLLRKRARTSEDQATLDFEGLPGSSDEIPTGRSGVGASAPRAIVASSTHRLFIASVVLLDLLSVGAALFASALVRFPAPALLSLGESVKGIALVLLGGFSCVAFLSARGAYAPRILLTRRIQTAQIVTAVVPSWALVQLLAFWLKVEVPFESRMVVALSLPISITFLVLARLLVTRPLAFRFYPRLSQGTVLVLGGAHEARVVTDDLAARDSRGRAHVAHSLSWTNTVLSRARLDRVRCGEVVLLGNGDGLDTTFDAAFYYLDTRREVRIISSRLQWLDARAGLPAHDGVPVLQLRRPDLTGPEAVLKRWIDVVGATCGIILLAPLLAIVASAIKLDSRGPILFSQERVGFRGRRFRMLKFRTMAHGNDPQAHHAYLADFIKGGSAAEIRADGTQVYKLTNDSRITRVGGWLRRYSIDELPQLWNVLRGEMSLVGPRPCTTYEWELHRPWQRRRMDVAPGCTGLWQVRGRSRVNFEEMILLDLHYAHHWTPIGDLWLIAQTVPAVIRGSGGY